MSEKITNFAVGKITSKKMQRPTIATANLKPY